MSDGPKKNNTLRTFVTFPIKVLGMLMLPPVMLLFRALGINRPPSPNHPQAHQFLGVLTLFIALIVLFVLWGGWQLFSILILHTWAMLVFSRCEGYLRLNISEFWRRVMVLLQLTFIVILALIDFSISLYIVASFLLIAKISSLLIYEQLPLYSFLLAQDRFDAYYWWRKRKNISDWERCFLTLQRKQFHQSMADIISQYLLAFNDYPMQLKYTPVMLKGWVMLRKYQILPDDLILHQYPKSNKKAGNISPNAIIGFACHFEAMAFLIEKANQEAAYTRLLRDFLQRLQKDMEQFIQKPVKVSIDRLLTPLFESELDVFLAHNAQTIHDILLQEQFDYCYGLFYVASGIAKNV